MFLVNYLQSSLFKSSRSISHMRNKSGPKTVPCSTPLSTKIWQLSFSQFFRYVPKSDTRSTDVNQPQDDNTQPSLEQRWEAFIKCILPRTAYVRPPCSWPLQSFLTSVSTFLVDLICLSSGHYAFETEEQWTHISQAKEVRVLPILNHPQCKLAMSRVKRCFQQLTYRRLPSGFQLNNRELHSSA